jgi:ATP-dependent Clp protease protease subunit
MAVDQTLRVPYTPPGNTNPQWVNIYARLREERILFINQPITSGLANSIVSALLYLDSEDQTKPISLYINSYGNLMTSESGNDEVGMMTTMAGLAIYDTIQHIKSEVYTIAMGQAIGMATVLLSSGAKGKRASLPHSMIALSHPQAGTRGQATDIQINAKEVLEKQALVLEILAHNTNQIPAKVAKDMERMRYMTPEQAQEYGLIDRVL